MGGINQNVTNSIVPGEDYQVNATARVGDPNTIGYVGMRFATETDELIDLQFAEVSSSNPTEQQVNFTAPENFAQAELFAFKNVGSGAFFVDDFEITQQ